MTDIFMKFPEMDLGDVVLRELRTGDAKEYFEYLTDEHVMKYVARTEVPASVFAAESEMSYWSGLFKTGQSFYWAIADKKTDKMIGSCGFNYWRRQHNRVELAYDLSYAFWGKGIMTRAVDAVTKFSLEKMLAQRIQATVVTDNDRSIKVLERCGYKREGTLKKYFNLHNQVKDSYMYGKVS